LLNIGSKYDIALSRSVAEMKSRIWNIFAEQAVQALDAVSLSQFLVMYIS